MMNKPKYVIDAISDIGQLALSIAETFQEKAIALATSGPLDYETALEIDRLMGLTECFQRLANTCDLDYQFCRRTNANLPLKDTD